MGLIEAIVIACVAIGAILCGLILRDGWRAEAREHDRRVKEILEDPENADRVRHITPDML